MSVFRLPALIALGPFAGALVLGLLISAAGVLVTGFAQGEALEQNFGLRWLFAVRGPVAPPPEVMIVAIDEQSARELGLQDRPSTWPRSLHAELVRHLAKAGARVVSFDLTFDVAAAQPQQDQEFAEAIAAAGNVLLAESVRREVIQLQGDRGGPFSSAVIESRASPIPLLAQAARGNAPFMLPKESRVDTYWTFLDDARLEPTLPVLAFQAFGDETFRAVESWISVDDRTMTRPSGVDAGMGGRGDAARAGKALPEMLAADPQARSRLARHLREVPSVVGDDRHRLVGNLLALYTTGESRYLNFYGPPRTISTVPYSRAVKSGRSQDVVRDGAANDVSFQGKAVFVGYAAATPGGQDRLRDDYRTVYSLDSGLDLSGVEIAATAFANLVDGRAIHAVPPGWQFSIVAVWGLALGLLCRLVRPIFASLIVVAVSAGYLWIVLEQFVDASLWLPSVVPVGIQTPLALFAGVWLNYRDTRREREAVQRAFGFFLPRRVVEQLTRGLGPMTQANQVLFGACLSTDAEKYTTLAEQTAPGRLGEMMNEYYAHLFVPVERLNGVVADVVGDSMVAVWARSSTDFDVRRNACQAALDICKSLQEFNATGGAGLPLHTRFGLHSGDMLFGNIGASRHYEYRAVGDIVNTASRIQGLNKVLGTRILASSETAEGLDDYATRPLGSFLLAGKANAVAVVELIGQRHELTLEQSRRLSEFAFALKAFEERRWAEAAQLFAAILESDPDDGAARFYEGQCRRLALAPPQGQWSPTIRVDSK